MPLTLRQSLEKRLDGEQVEEVLSILNKHWQGEYANDLFCVMNRKKLVDLVGTKELADRVEEVYAKENTRFDRIYNFPRLNTDVRWGVVDVMVKKMDETKECPFCNRLMDTSMSGAFRCRPCSKVFHTA